MVKGILLQLKGPFGVVMTADGRFVRVLVTTKDCTPGQEVEGRELTLPSLKQGLAVASVLLILITGLWANFMINPAVAYVALDINPSLELAVNDTGVVIGAKGLDQDGRDLLAQVHPKKLEIYRAVELLVEGAAHSHYLNDRNNVVLTTVTSLKENAVVIDEEKLQMAVKKKAEELTAPVKVVSQQATIKEHKEADNRGLSVGRYLIYQGSSGKGKEVSLEEVKTKGLGQLEKEKGIRLEQMLPRANFKGKVWITPVAKKQVENPAANKEKGMKKQEPKNVQDKPKVDSKVMKPIREEKELEDKKKDNKEDNKMRRDDRRHNHLNDTKNDKKSDKKQTNGSDKGNKDKWKDRDKDKNDQEKRQDSKYRKDD
ncbi:anti-sigma factor domain-containing protein [Desulforamulus aeronauticus]|uniref:RsgI N-terminal anti-sigma domain-containing protein n=1 Tax=Desulforamulus aeronauticus DSM 10349 TaxID=1121421 RepID=A0A1M6R5L3_9FIRM|nr:hypothetical protein [Desulforamulus aeronauticus]SHK27690.1 hypothetical protein SAMN02745123_01308 [Desulforamulus aeronauticus DSM 10349]